jgi:predicted transcriptional regulator
MSDVKQAKIQILDKTLKQGFSQIPRIVLKAQGLSLQSKTIYALLLDYAWQKGSCFPGQNRLAKDLGVHRNTVQKYLTELKDYGLVEWKRRGINKTNIYYLLPLDFLHDQHSDAQGCVHPVAQERVHQDAQETVQEVEEEEYKKKKYKQPLTLPTSQELRRPRKNEKTNNDNEEFKNQENTNLDSFDTEAVAIATELNDTKNILYYQKLINRRNRGEVKDSDIQQALDDTRRMIRTDQVDGTNFLRNPASWFVSIIKKLNTKRDEEKNKEKVESLLSNFKAKFSEKSKL